MQNETQDTNRLYFNSDYLAGCHEKILQKLVETNLQKEPGYGSDCFTRSAKEKILRACGLKDGAVFFLVGGTQTNDTVISTILRPYEGVFAAESGHIATHEAGIIEVHGHKVLALPGHEGKLHAEEIQRYMEHFHQDASSTHMVQPKLVYLSQPTELGTLYSLKELEEIKAVCQENDLYLFLDGARLAYALACKENDVSLPDLARLCDVFYIGGTKCGALFGEAVVVPDKGKFAFSPTTIKQHGALLAKGKLLGIQFDTLFTDDLYTKLGRHALLFSDKIRDAVKEKGIPLLVDSPTNQIFIIVDKAEAERIAKKAELANWDNLEGGRSVLRICTSWSTEEEDVKKLLEIL